MQTSLTFPKSSELQLDTEDELSVDPGILFSSEFRAIAGDLIDQVSAQFGKKHLLRRQIHLRTLPLSPDQQSTTE
jgi:hypothetical protein